MKFVGIALLVLLGGCTLLAVVGVLVTSDDPTPEPVPAPAPATAQAAASTTTQAPAPETTARPAPATTEPEPDPMLAKLDETPLQRGDRGDDVAAVQVRLIEWGHSMDADGNYGPRTEAAVRAFQSEQGIDDTGQVDGETWLLLQSTPPTVEDRLADGPLQNGDQNADVVEVQKRLVVWGFDVGVADGSYGNRTEAAVQAFQTLQETDPTGRVDIQTWKLLLRTPEPCSRLAELLERMTLSNAFGLEVEIIAIGEASQQTVNDDFDLRRCRVRADMSNGDTRTLDFGYKTGADGEPVQLVKSID